ncbi:MAG TPA: phosphatidate cytidylyltransferase [Tepidisphaeraceae bacterium]|nr:phosphatidate cytidylyltransferase [Tepidisphaeraceae bacterium]
MERALRNRLTFGPLMLAALLALLWFDHTAQILTRQWEWNHFPNPDDPPAGVGGIGLLIVLSIVLPPATVELATLFAAERVRPYRLISATGSALLVIHAFCTQFRKFQLYATSSLAFIIVGVMLWAAARRALRRQTQEAITHMAGTLLATLYLGGLGWFLMALRVKHSAHPGRFNGTTMVIVMILLVVKCTDIGAFFGGRAFGKRKLILWLSPGKTWEGLFFGLLTAGAVGALCARWINPPNYQMAWWKGVIFGIVIGAIGQIGDLLESMMKRDAEVKDSGSLIPGFGGILDVIDSPLLAAPFAYLLFSIF